MARDAVIRAVARQARAYPELAPDALDYQLDSLEGVIEIRPLDAAFAHAIYDAVVRRWLTLAFLLHREIRQGYDGLEPRVQAVLLAGAAQLLFLDRVPAHAVINHAVEWAKQEIRPGAGGLVNAVLRRIAAIRAEASIEPGPWAGAADALPFSTGSVLRHAAISLPDDDVDRLAIATSHPRELLLHWARHLDRSQLRAQALHSLIEPPVLVNTQFAGPDLTAVPAGVLLPHGDQCHGVYVDQGFALTRLLASSRGIWVQDPSSAGAVRSIADLRPSLIIDLCAGQGTKTRQLAATFPNAKIIATDIDEARYGRLEAAFEGREQVTVAPFARARDQGLMRCDLVVLDVPCSNTGVLPRRPEARYRFGAKTLESLTATQRQLLADSIPLLNSHPGSKPSILYATCSLESEENSAQSLWARKWHRFEIDRERVALPTGQPGDPPGVYQDGAYSVLLRSG